MKKTITMILCVIMLSLSSNAFAAGKLSVEKENFHAIESYLNYGYAYAKVSNIGNKPIKVNAGVLEIYNESGDALTSSDYISAYAVYLQPGEYTYVKMYSQIENGTADDYMMTLTGKADDSRRSMRLPVETDLQLNVKSGWWTYNYMYVTVTNNTSEPVFDISVVMALLDKEGNILYIDDDSLYSTRALMPGSSIMIRADIPSSFMDYFKIEGYVPSSVDAIAYVNVDND